MHPYGYNEMTFPGRSCRSCEVYNVGTINETTYSALWQICHCPLDANMRKLLNQWETQTSTFMDCISRYLCIYEDTRVSSMMVAAHFPTREFEIWCVVT